MLPKHLVSPRMLMATLTSGSLQLCMQQLYGEFASRKQAGAAIAAEAAVAAAAVVGLTIRSSAQPYW